MRNDRLAVLGQEGTDEATAMADELRLGLESLAEDAAAGAARFAGGAGRHGEFPGAGEPMG